MNWKIDWIRALTPPDTEEVKPGVFIQKKGNVYRQIYPAAWNGKINWKNFLIGSHFWRNFIVFLILMFLVFAYVHDTHALKDFYVKVTENKIAWCAGVPLSELKIGVKNESQSPIGIQNNPS